MGYIHEIEEAIIIDPPIPASAIPADHPLHPNYHPGCINRYTRARVPSTVYGHEECMLPPDLMFDITGEKVHAIVPATRIGHKLGAPFRDVEEVVSTFGKGRTLSGYLLFRGEEGEDWTIKVINGSVVVEDEER
ncbi:hypothetical protein ACFY4C_41290 [Actinomadura viridis]|uniref:hypothetical protein n=1 Tax=Actinomadura viridis TaxID=58110 RepID=UPI00369CEC82